LNASSPARAFVGLGANLGDPRVAVKEALRQLAALPGTTLMGASSLYRSAPIDATGPAFINAVAELRTTLSPHELLHHLQAIEQAHGRERPYRNAPRTLDLDLLLVDGCMIDDAELTLPHPRLHQRAFVLVPLAELAPDLCVPGRGTVNDLLVKVRDQSVTRLDDEAAT
jgi:2-amino-4-hydroxy-6-hydroxymethyldihydropteridine diphosphokinase